MELKHYSVFHIGIKTNANTSLDEFKPIMKEFASSKDFELVKNENLDLNKVISKGFNPNMEIIAKKEDTRIEFNLLAGAINFVGKDSKEVSDLYKEALEFLEKKNYEPLTFVNFFEILAVAHFENGKSPSQILKEKTNFNVEELSKMGEGQVNMVQIKSASSEEENAFDMSISINSLKPSKEFIIKIIKRSRDIEFIYNFHTLIEDSVSALLKE